MIQDTPGSFLFLHGADMDPTRVLATWPGARFLARAWVAAGETALPPLPEVGAIPALPGAARSPADAVWGILLGLPAPTRIGVVEARTDDERPFAATIGTDSSALADRAAVLAAARYWELPPLYVRRLAAWAEPADRLGSEA